MENSFSTVALKSLNYATINFFQGFSRHILPKTKKKKSNRCLFIAPIKDSSGHFIFDEDVYFQSHPT
jgi:hypothetical protein